MDVLFVGYDEHKYSVFNRELKAQSLVTAFSSFGDATHYIRAYEPKLVTLCNPEWVRAFRKSWARLPVMVFTESAATQEARIKAFEDGADDFIEISSIDASELMWRIRSLIRRSYGYGSHMLRNGNVVLNMATRCLEIDDQKLELRPMYYKILELLFLNKGKLVTHEKLLNHLYGDHYWPQSRILNTYFTHIKTMVSSLIDWDTFINNRFGSGWILQDLEIEAGRDAH